MERSSFVELDTDNSMNFKTKVSSWISKWTLRGVVNNNWKSVITSLNSTPEKVYGLEKTHKINNPVRVITSGCNTAT